MRTFLGTLIACLLMAAPAVAATVPVTSLSGDFGASNSSVRLTPDGVNYGVYHDGGSAGGSLFYTGADGLTLNDLSELNWVGQWNSTDDSPLAAPYLRIFLQGGHDVIFDATHCATQSPGTENENHTFQVVGNDVRYDDDGCDGVPPDQQSWADVLAAHGTEVIDGIYITQGFAGGADDSAFVRELSVNGTVYCFTCPAPQPAPIEQTFITQPTTVTQAPPVVVTPGQQCKGNELRHIHAPTRRGERFLSTRATLRGQRLPVNGRTITVDLSRQAEGNYNVRLTSKYRTRHHHTRTVKTTRNLSVVCA